MAYCFFSFSKVKTDESLAKRMDHNLRMEASLVADYDKNDLVRELVRLSDDSYVAAVNRMISVSSVYKHKAPRCGMTRAIEFLFTYTGSPKAVLFDRDAWELKNVEWVRKYFGSNNVVSVVSHYDEATPHIHALVIPMVDGRLNANFFVGSVQKCMAMKDDYAEAMKEFGLTQQRS